MPLAFLLARIDDRLLHGQVAIGWAASLKPSRIYVVDDAVAASAWETSLYCANPPPGAEVLVLSLEAFAALAVSGALEAPRAFLLVRSASSALRLAELGVVPASWNVGGLRHAEKAREILPYVWVRPADEDAFRDLAARGVPLLARDLPMNPEHDLAALLAARR
jgi:mannose/fructose/N-acetylgalactosamine-specific phosphotransferase system component IIB